MRQPAIDKMHALHALFEGADRTLHLRTHALVDNALFFEILHLADLQGRNERIRIRRRRNFRPRSP